MTPSVFRVEHEGWLSNAYLVTDRLGGHGVVIDTGAPVAPIIAEAERLGVRVPWILATHFHHDHVAGNAALAKRFGAAVGAHRLDEPSSPVTRSSGAPSEGASVLEPAASPIFDAASSNGSSLCPTP
jgi:hydroxyacylglutathione hydrolase